MKDDEWLAIGSMFPRSTELTCTWVIQAGFPTWQSLPAERKGALLVLRTPHSKPVKCAILSRVYNGFVTVSLFHTSSCKIYLVIYACSYPVNETACINWIYFSFLWQKTTHSYENLRVTLVRFNLQSACLHNMTEVRCARHLTNPWDKLRKTLHPGVTFL